MANSPRPNLRKLRCEHLEDRRLLAVVTVDTIEDIVDLNDGRTSLREAIFATNTVPGADEIVFDFDRPATILLTQGELQITDSLTISGPGAELLTIDASGNDPTPDSTYEDGDDTNDGDGSSVFLIDDGRLRTSSSVEIQGLTITGSDHPWNGAVESEELLRLSRVTVIGNSRFGVLSHEVLEIADSLIKDNSGIGVASRDLTHIGSSTITGNTGLGISVSASTTIDDSEISNNIGDENGYFGTGGGIDAYHALTIRNSSITGNSGRFGGGVYARFGPLLIDNTTIEGNSSGNGGGGIHSRNGQLSVISSSIIGNSTQARNGGGIYSRHSTTSVHDSVITENSAYKFGGGIYSEGTLEVVRSRISGNEARLVGGIVSRGELKVSETTVSDNNGGVLAFGRTNISDSTISRNTEFGGIFLSDGSDLDLSNSTVSGNTSRYEGGGIRGKGRQYISHSTITNNTTETGNGGGIYGSQITLDHSIVAGNFDGSGAVNDVAGEVTNNFSLIGEGAEFLSPLADNGGPTPTHALLPGSPAINAGDLSAVAGEDGVPDFDQRGAGFDRIVSRIDIGAYEVQELGDMNLVVDTLVDESDGDFSPGDLSLREAIELANANPVPDTISFFPFTPTGASQRKVLLTEGELVIRDDLTISGAGLNRITIDASGNDPTPGQDDGEGSRVFRVDDLDSEHEIEVTLSELTITGGDVSGVGGGILSHEKLTLESVVVDSNSATVAGGGLGLFHDAKLKDQTSIIDNFAARGGGVSTIGRTLHIADSSIGGNQSTESGGGIFAESGAELQLTNASVGGNDSLGENAFGGGIDLSDSTLLADESYFTSNFASRGGSIWSENSIVSLRNSAMESNRATNSGSAIAARDSQIEIEGSELRNNGRRGRGGGALDVTRGLATIRNSVFQSNRASSNLSGGAIAISGYRGTANLQIVGTEFLSNSGGSGGAIHIAGVVNASIGDSRFVANSALGSQAFGGAIFSDPDSELLVEHTEFLRNRSVQYGGAIYAGGSLQLGNALLHDNHAEYSGGAISFDGFQVSDVAPVLRVADSEITNNSGSIGGGVESYGSVDITRSTISGNSAKFSGGGIRSNDELVIKYSIVSGNTGGGIDAHGPTHVSYSTISNNSINGGIHISNRRRAALELNSSTISGNSTNSGGGGINGKGTAIISFSTITNNIADADGDGLGSGGGISLAQVSLDHTIVAGNTDRSNRANDIAGIFDSKRSLIGVGADALGPLQDNGGPTPTHAPLPNRFLVDSGDPSYLPGEDGVPEFDQRGNPYRRIFRSRIDIGAVEYQPIPGDFDSDGDSDPADLASWTENYGTLTDGNGFLNWQRTFGDGVTPPRRSSSPIEESAAEAVDAVDLAIAAEFANQRATEQPTRGPVARRNAYASAEVLALQPATTNHQPRPAIVEHASTTVTSSNSERAEVSFALDEALSELFVD